MITAVPARWAHPRDADGRYIPQDPPPVVMYLDIDDVLNECMWLRRSDVKAAHLALFQAPRDPAARRAYATALAAVLDDQVDAPLMDGLPVACVTPVGGVSDDDIAALRRALPVAWVAYEAGRPVSARCGSREQVAAWLEANTASAELVEASGLADPPPPTRPPTLWERIAALLVERRDGVTVGWLAATLSAPDASVRQALRRHGGEVKWWWTRHRRPPAKVYELRQTAPEVNDV